MYNILYILLVRIDAIPFYRLKNEIKGKRKMKKWSINE